MILKGMGRKFSSFPLEGTQQYGSAYIYIAMNNADILVTDDKKLAEKQEINQCIGKYAAVHDHKTTITNLDGFSIPNRQSEEMKYNPYGNLQNDSLLKSKTTNINKQEARTKQA